VTNVPTALLAPRHWPTWLGVGLFALLAYCPWKTRRWLGTLIGGRIYYHNHKRRYVVLTNLRLCFPELSKAERKALAREHLNSYANALLDYSLLFFRPRHWLYRRTQLQGRKHIDTAIQAGQNVILLLGHSVWLEFAPMAIGEHYRAYGSYKPFSNPVANWLIARSRLRDVESVIAREEGMIKLVRTLEPGRLMFFLPDEDHGLKHSVFAPFLGTPKATLTTPARLAKLGNAVCLPLMAFQNPQHGGYEIVVGEALPAFPNQDETINATLLNQGLETLIRQYPAQYMWLLKFFRTRQRGQPNLY